jgi:ParB-like chromosome segregation protein Spo0J
MAQWPADNVERRTISGLIPYANNARTHSETQVAQIAASMREWGWTNPILVDEQGTIIAGHGRVMAAQKLGYTEAPVMVAKGWSKAQMKAYVLADNQLAANAGWDADLLKVELADLDGLNFDLSLVGFDTGFMAAMFDQVDFEPGSIDEQGKLDELAPKIVQCPHCGEDFDLRHVQS